HPQSIVHSLVELADGAQMGHFAVPDMRIPIAGCLSWPYLLDNRVTGVGMLELAKVGTLTFEEPRHDLFPCLDLARRAFAERRTVELNAANEVAVARFLGGDIGFTDIPALVSAVVDEASPLPDFALGDDLSSSVEAALAEIERRDAAARIAAEAWRP
ncbi:MAG: 1-deoxy-D-xylulose-5-phosphate reductoisomerase, partial [Mailhella sp.]|nr:1-deoxy-D-xylulose-5-phosphate reductoisomerase [Mailhella sp.]